MTDEKGERIAKVMARAGLCSRRDAEKWIAAGRVSVNGEKLTTPAIVIGPKDTVLVDGQQVGTVKLMDGNNKVGEFPVVALEEVPEAGFFGRLWDTIRLWFKRK